MVVLLGKIDRREFLKLSAVTGVVTYSALASNDVVLNALQRVSGKVPLTSSQPMILRTAHANNCDGSCGLAVTVADGNITKISSASFDNPAFPPRICLRGLSNLQYVYHPDRLKYPMRRTGDQGAGQWERISWDEATTAIANAFTAAAQKYGSKSVYVAPYTGSLTALNGLIGPGYRFASVIGASGGDFFGCNEGDSASPAGAVEALGNFDGHDLSDLRNSRMIILWGNNLAETDVPDMRFALDAREAGAKIVNIDPRYTSTAALSDEWISIRPGTDGALALSMMNVIITEGLFNEKYVVDHTVGTFLVRDDTKLFLRQKDIAGGDSDKYMVYDSTSKTVVPSDQEGITPALTGAYSPSEIGCKPGFQLLVDLANQYPPAKAEKITDVAASQIESLARDFATRSPAAIKAGFGGISHWYYGDLSFRAMITLSAYVATSECMAVVLQFTTCALTSALDIQLVNDKKAYTYIVHTVLRRCLGRQCISKAAWFSGQFCNNRVTQTCYRSNEGSDFVWSDIFMTATAQYADMFYSATNTRELTARRRNDNNNENII